MAHKQSLDARTRDVVFDHVFFPRSRRAFLRDLAAAGLSVSFAGRIVSLAASDDPPLPEASSAGVEIEGRGGDVLVEQLERSGVRFVFANPSSGSGPVFDALIDRPGMQVILALHEATLAAMADGYAKASGKVPFVIVARPGAPNTLGGQYNAFRDRTPIVFCTDNVAEPVRGSFATQEVDDLLACAVPFTRWQWESRTADNLAVDLRRAFKFTTTPPCGPVFLSIPRDLLAQDVSATVYEQPLFDISHEIRADEAVVAEVARLLVSARSPLLYVGNEAGRYGAVPHAIQLAELLSIPVMHQEFSWCNAFPTDHPLFLGSYQPRARFPADVDLMLDLGGGRGPYQVGPAPAVSRDRALIEAKLDIDSMGRLFPAHLSVPANARLFAADLVEAIGDLTTARERQALADLRGAKVAEFGQRLRQSRLDIGRERWADVPLSHERLGMELEQHLHEEAILVHEADSARVALNYLTFGPGRKALYTVSGLNMGWAASAALGVKLAQPDHQVVALIGDGGFMFGGTQLLWTAARYQVPIIVIVVNNRSYDGERTRLWARGSRQAESGRDMICYLGDPDIEFGQLAAAYGVPSLKVVHPDELAPALARAGELSRDGAPVLLDIMVGRRGAGADSTWHPDFSLARRMRTGA